MSVCAYTFANAFYNRKGPFGRFTQQINGISSFLWACLFLWIWSSEWMVKVENLKKIRAAAPLLCVLTNQMVSYYWINIQWWVLKLVVRDTTNKMAPYPYIYGWHMVEIQLLKRVKGNWPHPSNLWEISQIQDWYF